MITFFTYVFYRIYLLLEVYVYYHYYIYIYIVQQHEFSFVIQIIVMYDEKNDEIQEGFWYEYSKLADMPVVPVAGAGYFGSYVTCAGMAVKLTCPINFI